ncbi:MAG: sigma-70 family RNA polymerase sigma factor [Hormoscilla sp.]
MSDRPGPSDRELVRRCLQGYRHSYQQLYCRHQGQVRSTLYQLCGPSHLDDLVQEVFLRVWKGLPKFRQASQFSTWLYRIVWNVASTERRQLAQAYEQQQTLCQAVGTSPDNSDLMHLHYQDLVRRGLAKLSLDHRAVLVLHDLEDVPQKEVAKILSVPVGTVKSRLFHARAAMRKFLQAEGVQL